MGYSTWGCKESDTTEYTRESVLIVTSHKDMGSSAIGMLCVEQKDAAKHPTMHRKITCDRESSTPNVSGATMEKT